MKKIFLLLVLWFCGNAAFALATLGNAGLGPLGAGTICIPSTAIIQEFTIVQTAVNTNLTNVQFTTAGTYVAADMTNFNLLVNTVPTFATATNISTIAGAGVGAHNLAIAGHTLTAGTTYYFWITATVPVTATIGHTISVNAIANANITISAGPKAGASAAGGVQTISSLPTAVTASAAPNPLCAGADLTLTGTATNAATVLWTGPGGSGYTAAVLNPPAFAVTATDAGIFTLAATNSCGTTNATTAPVVVNPAPTGVTASAAPNPLCTGSNLTLTGTATGAATYLWTGPAGSGYSSAVLNPPAFASSMLDAGIFTLTATTALGCSASASTAAVVVDAIVSPITGVAQVCVGSTTTLSDISVGGSWTTSNGAISTVGGTGNVTGVATGIDTITYTVGACSAFVPVTVSAIPTSGIISGPTNICIGSTGNLLDAVIGGTWSVSNSSASISGVGLVTGLSTGIDTITYLVSNFCGVALTNYTDTISPAANSGFIVGPTTVCAGSFAFLTDTAAGGVWSLSNANGTIDGTGLFSALDSGIDSIFYTITTSCSTSVANKVISINPLPDTGIIGGPSIVCVMATINLTETVAGGTWSSNNANATVSGAGVVTGVTAGTDTIKYAVTNSCGTLSAGWAFTIDAIGAGVITGPANVCVGSLITLADATPGGNFSSGNLDATITSGGILTGLMPGADTITYTIVSLCGSFSTTQVITVQPIPNAGIITGPGIVCQGAMITLSESIPGGIWASDNNAIATVDSATGVVTGVSGATVNINYLVTSVYGCIGTTSFPVTVDPAPAVNAITGVTNECVGATATLADMTPAGTWSSSNSAIASIDTTSGVVSGLTGGIVTISYSITDALGCIGSATIFDTVNTIPFQSLITGSMLACIGMNDTLTDSVPGGAWTSTNTGIAMIDPVSGILTGVNSGSLVILYNVTNPCGSVTDTAIITVNSLPAVGPISGPAGNICSDATTLLTESTAGGSWASSNTSIATVADSTGWVTGVSAGSVTITYTISNTSGCSNYSTINLTFGGTLSASVTPVDSVSMCHGSSVNMHVLSSGSGLTYQWLNNDAIIPGATNDYYNATTTGNYAVITGNSTCSETIAGPTVTPPVTPTITFVSPNLLYTGSYLTYQWLRDGIAIPGATTSVYTVPRNGNYNVMVTDGGGCSDTSGVYSIDYMINEVNTVSINNDITFYPNPATTTINIEAPQNVNVMILAPDGKVWMQISETRTINVASLPDGLYLIKIYDKNNLLLKTAKFTRI